MNKNYHSESRKRTPWTDDKKATPLQQYLDGCNLSEYEERHPLLSETGEAGLLNSYPLDRCRFCGSGDIIHYGKTRQGVDRYLCKECGRMFSITTGTIFDSHKIPVSSWLDFMREVFSFQSFKAISRSMRIADSTARYWVEKLFLLLRDSQDSTVLSGDVWIDETYYKVVASDVETIDGTREYRGLSRNQICIGIGCDKHRVYCKEEGMGKPSMRRTWDTFSPHIATGSRIIHDGDKSHGKLVTGLGLASVTHNSKELKNLPDEKNPMDPVNEQCMLLKKFFSAHSGFARRYIRDYLNLFAFMMNPPDDTFKKADLLLFRALETPNSLKYRNSYANEALI